MSIIISIAYLAPIQYYTKYCLGDNVYIEQYENYVKQTYRNRCTILSANGILNLSIPIESSDGNKVQIRDVRIAKHGNWQHLHWNALISAYNSTPYFEFYRDYFEPFYRKQFTFLFDLNEQLHSIICDLLEIPLCYIKYTSKYVTEFESDDLDFRDTISPKNTYDLDPQYKSIKYYQAFEQRYGFVENLSILDLLFNMGNESQLILQSSITSN